MTLFTTKVYMQFANTTGAQDVFKPWNNIDYSGHWERCKTRAVIQASTYMNSPRLSRPG